MRDKGLPSQRNVGWTLGILLAGGLFLLYQLGALTLAQILEIVAIFLLVSICFLIGLLAQLFLHELGHCLFGRLTGYEFVSLRMFGFILSRGGGHFFISRFRMEGTEGQCLMAPSDRVLPEKHPVALYNLGGSIINLLVAGVSLGAWQSSSKNIVASAAWLSLFGIGLCYGLLNAVPLRVRGTANDGYNLRMILKSEAARVCFLRQLQINAALVKGLTYRQMPAAWFELPSDADWNNPMVAGMGLPQINLALERMDFQNARAHVDWLLEHANGLLFVHRMELLAERLFLALLGRSGESAPDSTAWTELRTADLEDFLRRNACALSHIRQLYALARLADDDPKRTRTLREEFEAIASRPSHPGEVPLERSLMDRVDALHEKIYGVQARGFRA